MFVWLGYDSVPRTTKFVCGFWLDLSKRSFHWKSASAQKQVVVEAIDAQSLGFGKIQLDEAEKVGLAFHVAVHEV